MKFMLTVLPLGLAFLLGACSDDDSPSATETGGEADLVVVTRIDDTTGFINRIDSSEAGTTTNANGAEINPAHNVYKYGDAFFTTGGLVSDRVARYVDNEGVLTETASMNAGPGSYP